MLQHWLLQHWLLQHWLLQHWLLQHWLLQHWLDSDSLEVDHLSVRLACIPQQRHCCPRAATAIARQARSEGGSAARPP
jgi:hypothetical protein